MTTPVRTLAGVLACAAGLLPAAAEAATVSSDGIVITFNAGAGERNYTRVLPFTGDGGEQYLEIREDGGDGVITLDPATEASRNCVYLDSGHQSVVCDGQRTVIDTGDLNDLVIGGPRADAIDGGGGNDELLGGGADDTLNGGPGDDSLESRGGSNASTPEASYAGADDLRGGDGTDLLSYYTVTRGLTLSLDDQPNDTDGDNVHSDLERVEGGSSDDRITGNDGPNRLEGAGGSDIVSGAGGNDTVLGGTGIDQVMGDAGNDEVNGETHGDVVDGGSGVDNLIGDARCETAGCGGPDHIKARDGEGDNVVCRDDNDTVEADDADAVAGDCENVQRGPAGGGADTAPPEATVLIPRRPRLGASLQRGLTFSYSCNEVCGIAGQAAVSGRDARGLKQAKTVVVARGTSLLTAAGTGKVKLKFTRKAKAKLRSRRSVTLRVTMVVSDSAGNLSTLKGKVTLKR